MRRRELFWLEAWKMASEWIEIAERHEHMAYRINNQRGFWEPRELASLALDGAPVEAIP